MRVTDPNAIKTIKHPSDDAEFDISVSMPKHERTAYTEEMNNLPPNDSGIVTKTQALYEKIVKSGLRQMRFVYDANGEPLEVKGTVSNELLKKLFEIRLPEWDNLVIWLGQEIYKENMMTEEAKKKLESRLTSDSTKSTETA
jgi:hypothetical protein